MNKKQVSITKEQINNVATDSFCYPEWKPLIDFFWDRYNKRYFNQIECLQYNSDFELRNNCGFLIATIDCILIETLEQYYSGKDETKKGETDKAFLSFFQRSEAFEEIVKDKEDAGKFAGLIRSGLLHQSKAKQASIINKKSLTPILDWIDKDDKNKGFQLNRDKFHKSVLDEYRNLVEKLKKAENSELRERFKSKLLTLIE